MEKRWIYPEPVDDEIVEKLSSSLNLNKDLTTLLAQRKILTFNTAKTFFRPSLNQLHDPFLMKDMEKAVNRLCEAISSNDKILIYGDYDVDGTTSVALAFRFLKKFSDNLDYYIPDRYSEGYGISNKAIDWAHKEKFDLIIALDCGIRALHQADLAKSYGIDLIICDHHLPGDKLPDAYAVLDPKRSEDGYPFKELSGCGVGFKLMQGFCLQNTIPLEELFEFLDLLAISIASDIVPIIGENRVLAFYGLKKINHSPCPGLKALIEISGLKGTIDISNVVFYIGPRINAAGRLTHAKESVRLLIAETDEDTQEHADALNNHNTDRRGFDQSITLEALGMVESDVTLAKAKSTVLFKNDWHKGVIGIVASRCIEKYYRPTIILTESKNKATGSARSVEGFDIHGAIESCSDLLEQFGGHTHAAGLTLSLDNVSAFQKRFEEVVAGSIAEDSLIPKLDIDMEVDFPFINYKTLSILNQMSPFGPHNTKPVFVTKNVSFKGKPKTIKDLHLKGKLIQKGSKLIYECIGFGLAEKLEAISSVDNFQIAYQIEENEFMGNKSLQLNIKDIKIH